MVKLRILLCVLGIATIACAQAYAFAAGSDRDYVYNVSPPVETYRFKGSPRISVFAPAGATQIYVRLSNHKHGQDINLPRGWRITTDDDTRDHSVPPVIRWQRTIPTIVIVGSRESGVYDVRAPLVYELVGTKFRLLCAPYFVQLPDKLGEFHFPGGKLEFTDRGAFYVKRNRLYVWDFVCDWNYAHGAPQKYWLREFQLSHDKVTMLSNRVTKRMYSGIFMSESYPPDPILQKKLDPLCEFGLRWRWWGRSYRR